MIHTNLLRHTAFAAIVFAVAILATGCADEAPSGIKPSDTAQQAIPLSFGVVAGSKPFAFDSVFTSEAGVEYTVSKLRFYASTFNLIDSAGRLVPATLVNSAKAPLKYGVTLVDLKDPASASMHILVRPGTYKGLQLTLGVPAFDDLGQQLNHSNAAEKDYPLDVDADMYWGWDPGYIFMKLEGKSLVEKEWLSFVYHVGRDSRLMIINIPGTVVVKSDGTTGLRLKMDVNRVFVTPTGEHRPNLLDKAMTERMAHDGGTANTVYQNCVGSNFVTLDQ